MNDYVPPYGPDRDLVGFDWWTFASVAALGAAVALTLWARTR